MKRLIGIAGMVLLCWHACAVAKVVVSDFNFTNVDVEPLGNAGTANLTFRLTYDSTTPDTDPDPTIGAYQASLTLLIDGQPSGPHATVILVGHDNFPGFDEFKLSTPTFQAPLPSVAGNIINTAEFTLSAPLGQMWQNDHLPADTAFVAQSTNALIRLGNGDATESLSYDGFSASPGPLPIPVPEASTYAGLMFGLAGLLFMVRARRMRPARLHS